MKSKSGKGLFQSKKSSTFTKKVDAKIGKGFCSAVKMTTLTPILGGQILGAFAKEAIKAACFQGINGPMRTDKKYDYMKKCAMYVALFEQMLTPVIYDADALEETSDVLNQMAEDGMFVNLNYSQFIRHFRSQYLLLPEVEEDDLDLYLEDSGVQKELQALWVA